VTPDEKILGRLDELVAMGNRVLGTKYSVQVLGADYQVDSQLAHQWATSVQNLLARVFGQSSEHYKAFTIQVGKALSFSPTNRAQGILMAARDDFQHGHLFDLRQLIEAELFDEFLDQAQHLLDSGYYQPAAVIAGCVLEDGLRKLCHRHAISLPPKPRLDAMNAELAKAGVYSTLVQKRIIALADLRNKAAHGQWDEFGLEDVKEMMHAVRRIMEDHVA
jgi:hypothetical protein